MNATARAIELVGLWWLAECQRLLREANSV